MPVLLYTLIFIFLKKRNKTIKSICACFRNAQKLDGSRKHKWWINNHYYYLFNINSMIDFSDGSERTKSFPTLGSTRQLYPWFVEPCDILIPFSFCLKVRKIRITQWLKYFFRKSVKYLLISYFMFFKNVRKSVTDVIV